MENDTSGKISKLVSVSAEGVLSMTRCAELTILRQKFTLDTNPMNLTQLTLYSTINSENIIKEWPWLKKTKTH